MNYEKELVTSGENNYLLGATGGIALIGRGPEGLKSRELDRPFLRSMFSIIGPKSMPNFAPYRL